MKQPTFPAGTKVVGEVKETPPYRTCDVLDAQLPTGDYINIGYDDHRKHWWLLASDSGHNITMKPVYRERVEHIVELADKLAELLVMEAR